MTVQLEGNALGSGDEFRLLGGGNDDLGEIQIIDNEGTMQLTASTMASPYFKYLVSIVGGVGFLGMVAWSDPHSDLFSVGGLLFLSPVIVSIWGLLLLSEMYTRKREAKLLPLLAFEGLSLTHVRGQEVSRECNSISLVLVHAFDSPHGEVVELQIHDDDSAGERLLVVSELPGVTQYVLKRHVERIAKELGMSSYFVKTRGPLGKQSFVIKSIEHMTKKRSGPTA